MYQCIELRIGVVLLTYDSGEGLHFCDFFIMQVLLASLASAIL